ncbi:MAG: rhodanese-like domain-containing protein [Burkholderiales bacterium]|jgi:rhodanese-related sulfurtransferase|nr:rhodanese-like domain-containing protein [Burkholderiales bacterium]
MDTPETILARAADRARQTNLPYAGALTPAEAHALAQQVPGAKIVDVRTKAELDWVGHVPGAVHVEWNVYPGGARNPHFAEQLQWQVAKSDAPVMFLCRSGGRSHGAAAAAAALGYPRTYNILEGFEGDKDAAGHRGRVGGWKVAGLPWQQG